MEYQENEATAAVATESFEQSEAVDNNVIEISDGTTSAGSETNNSFFSTPAPEMPLPSSKKHRGSVTSVRTYLSANKGTPGIEINVHSDSNGKDYTKTIWVIEAYRENPNLDPKTLEGLPAPEGKTQTPFERYGRTIQNSKGSGELQQLINAALEVGRTFGRYTTFDELGEVLNAATNGIPVIFTDKPEETETGFTVKLGSLYGANSVDSKGKTAWDRIRAESADGQ